jgi:predicted component of type VI protein secretion system
MKLLFERLGANNADFDLEGAVLNNIQRLVSSRVAITGGDFFADEHEVKSAVPDTFDVLNCGVTSVVELGAGNRRAIERYGARLRALIGHYEPRLRQPGVEFERAVGTVPPRLIVSGAIETPDGLQPLRFPVNLRADG